MSLKSTKEQVPRTAATVTARAAFSSVACKSILLSATEMGRLYSKGTEG